MTRTENRTIIDLSHPLGEHTPAFPGDPAPRITILDSTETPNAPGERHLNTSHLALCIHCGTHMDAPFHFFGDHATIDHVLLERCIGTTVLVRLPWETNGPTIDPRHLAPHAERLRAARRVVLNTGWHRRWGADNYFSEHPLITGPAARFLVECGVMLVGVDTPSVDRPPFEAHETLLGAGVLIVENLTNLDAIAADEFHLIAAPLAIAGRDGSPVRAVAVL